MKKHFSVSALSKISILCPNIPSWYAYAKANISAYSNLVSSSSALTELGSVIGNFDMFFLIILSNQKSKLNNHKAGITTTDIASISTDNIGSVTTSAWTYMPAATVNALSIAQVSSLSTDQAAALLSNPNSGSFSSSITSALNSIIANTNINTTTNMSNTIQRFSLMNLLLFCTLALFQIK